MAILIEIMRGRWASAAIGAGVARHRASAEMEQQEAAHQREMEQLRAEQQREVEHMRELQNAKQGQSKPQQSGQEDVTQKLQKLADLKKQGILTDEEFQKLKMELLAKL